MTKIPTVQPLMVAVVRRRSSLLKKATTALHQGHQSVSFPSGLGAIACSVNTFVKSGDHILVADTVYGPMRSRICGAILKRNAVEVEFYDPMIGAGIKDLVRDNTSLVYMESPGSLTFEVQDVPAIVGALKGLDVITMIDNTWASGFFFKPLNHGVDIVVEASTKYTVGHSDAMLGHRDGRHRRALSCDQSHGQQLRVPCRTG